MSQPTTRTLVAYRAMAALYGSVTGLGLWVFARGLGEREIRSGMLLYVAFTGAAAIGLWLATRWGRAMALIVALGNAGVGTLSLLAVILEEDGRILGPALFAGLSVVAAYVLTRPVFGLPTDA